MKHLRPALWAALATACAALAACADSPPRQPEMDYRSRPPSAAQGAGGTSGSPDSRLIIRSGEGERLNLPWFIRDTQDWINSN